jgi:collagenase-like PrtC family protease
VDTLSRARYWQDLGADEITLESFSINRNFKALQAIRNGVSCALQLIVNHPCLPNCPMQPYHQNGLSHASDGSRRLFIDTCFLMCSQARLTDPSLLIKSQWIRPEDLCRYEALGLTRFKLLERNIPSAHLLKRVQAYSERRSCANFAELILPYGFPETPANRWRWLLRHFFRPFQLRPSKLRSVYEIIKKQGMLFPLAEQKIRIHSSRIPADFLKPFEQIDCTMTQCHTCGYCHHIAADAVEIDPAFRQDLLNRYEQLDHEMTTGTFWNV